MAYKGNPWANLLGEQGPGVGVGQTLEPGVQPLAASSGERHTITLPHALFGQSDAAKYAAIYANTTAQEGTVVRYIAAHITERVGLYRDRLGAFGLDVTPLLEQSLWAMAAADLGAIFRLKSGLADFASYDSNGALRRTMTNNVVDAASLIASIDGPSRFFGFLQLWQSIPEALRTEEMQRVALQFSCGTLRVESWLTVQRQAEFIGNRLLPWIEQDALGLVGAIPEGDMPGISVPGAEAGGGTSGDGDGESTTEYDAYQERVYRLMEQVRSYLSEKLRGYVASTPDVQAAYLAQGITLLSHAVRRAAVGLEDMADLTAACNTLATNLPSVTEAAVAHLQRPFPPQTFLNAFLTEAPAPCPRNGDCTRAYIGLRTPAGANYVG